MAHNPQHQIGIDFKQSLRQELTGYQNNKSGNYSLHQHHYKMIGNNSGKKIHLYDLCHQDTINDKRDVITTSMVEMKLFGLRRK